MQLTIERVTTRQSRLEFIKVPWKIYADNPNWVPPLIFDRMKLLAPEGVPFWKHASKELFLCRHGEEVVGRIAAIHDPRYEQTHATNAGYFGFFESINDSSVTALLFGAAEDWLRERGATEVIGPLQPSLNDEAGLLVDGFDDPPQVLMPYNPEYYSSLIESNGFSKIKDLYAWRLTKSFLTPKLKRVRDLVLEREGIVIREFRFSPKQAFNDDVRLLRRLYNDAWEPNWGTIQMSSDEVEAMADDLRVIAEKQMVLVAEKEGEPIGFVIALPDINQIFIHNKKGRLIPGILRLLTGKRKITRGRILALGLLPAFQRKGIDAALYYEIGTRMTGPFGYAESEASWILEDNHAMNNALAMMKGERYKTYRLYSKTIKEN